MKGFEYTVMVTDGKQYLKTYHCNKLSRDSNNYAWVLQKLYVSLEDGLEKVENSQNEIEHIIVPMSMSIVIKRKKQEIVI